LLADKKGRQYLASRFAAMARRKITDKFVEWDEADDPDHVGYKYNLVNGSLSHHLELRLGLLTPKHRSKVLKKYNITRRSNGDDLPHLFRGLLQTATKDEHETNQRMRRAAKEPKMSMAELYAAFGLPVPKKKRTASKKA
jgi:hypothetical protein